MTVAANLVGAWRRQHIEVIGHEPVEDSRVIWLQTPSRYADIRVPLAGLTGTPPTSEAFAGTQIWQEPQLTFEHEIDYTGNFPEDHGELSWEDSGEEKVLVEDGVAVVDGKTFHYRERWQRQCVKQPDYEAHYEAWEIRDGLGKLLEIALRVDVHVVVITTQPEFGACYYLQQLSQQDSWQLQWGIAAHPTNLFAVRHSEQINDLGWRLIESS